MTKLQSFQFYDFTDIVVVAIHLCSPGLSSDHYREPSLFFIVPVGAHCVGGPGPETFTNVLAGDKAVI